MIRGPTAGKHFMNGESIHPQTETMARIHNIHHITPGAIAMCAVLVSLFTHLIYRSECDIHTILSGTLGTLGR